MATAVEDSITTRDKQPNAVGHVLDIASPRLSVHVFPACPTSQHPTDPVKDDYPFPMLSPIHYVNTPSGRLVHFLDNWKTITQDNWVFQTVVGYKIPFCGSTSSVATKSHDNQVQHSDEAHEHCYPDASCKGSNQASSASQEPIYFLPIPSRESPIRRRISTNYQPEALKQICRRVVLQDGGSPGSPFVDTTERLYMMKLDLKDAYYSVPIHPDHRRFLRFVFNGKAFEFQCLPFGLRSAPRAFTRLMNPIIAHIRSLGIRIVIFLDDILILHQSPSVLQSIFKKIVTLLERLGFLINLNKCSQHPSQQLIFLGTLLNTVTMCLSLSKEKLDLIQQGARQLHTKGKGTLQELATLLGRMSHAAQNGIWLAPLHYRALQRVHSAGTPRLGCKNSRQSLELSQEAMRDLEWWLSQELQATNAQHLRCPPFDLVIHTDASLLG